MKTVTKIFIVVGILVLIFIVWALFFNENGILQTGWNSLAETVNGVWQKITGSSTSKILPTFSEAGVTTGGQNLEDSKTGF